MAGTIGYAVKYTNLNEKFAGESLRGVYSTYEKAKQRGEQLADTELNKMVTDWIVPYRWWNEKTFISIDLITLDEDID